MYDEIEEKEEVTCKSEEKEEMSKKAAVSSEVDVDEESSKTTAVGDGNLSEWLTMFRDWNSKTKVNALELVLELCEHAQIKHVHNYIEPKLQRDYISELPKELVLHMLTYVRPKDLYKLAQVSSYWQQIANDPILWRNICRRAGIQPAAVQSAVPNTLNCCEYHKSLSIQVCS